MMRRRVMSYEYVLEGSNVIFKELKGGDIMKMRTKGINILTILVYTMISLFTMSQPVQAATSEIITYEEYSDTIAKKYLEYGIETEMEPVSSGYVYTRELLNNELESIPVKVKYLKEWENKPVEIEGNSEDEKKSGIVPYAMYLDKTCTANKAIVDGLFTCSVKVKATLRVNAQSNSIIKANKPSLSVRSGNGFADYIKLISYTSSINNTSKRTVNHYASYNIKAELKKQISNAGLTTWTKVNKTIKVKMYPFK